MMVMGHARGYGAAPRKIAGVSSEPESSFEQKCRYLQYLDSASATY